ncbi:MAG: hypothetical protein AAFY56_00480 [Pseudomonadota bacterium]
MTTANPTIAVHDRARSADPFNERWPMPQAVLFIAASTMGLWLIILSVIRFALS